MIASMLADHPIVAFSLASFAVAASPGPSWIYVISTTSDSGRSGGFAAVLGNAAGIFCHVVAAALGVSAILTWSPVAYAVLKWIGACYLVYLGLRILRSQSPLSSAADDSDTARSWYSILRSGLWVNLLNPKVAILMLALLPQFVNPADGHTVLRTVGLGSIHVLIASCVLTCLVLAVGGGLPVFARSSTFGRILKYVSGSVLIGFGIRLALDGA